jgi:uncharacterized lipoprotein YajG
MYKSIKQSRAAVKYFFLLAASIFLLIGCTEDPDGTIEVAINIGGGAVNIGGASLRITNDRNFVISNGEIASVGNARNLSAITRIPTTGFATQVTARVGTGYVIRTNNGEHARLVIHEWTAPAEDRDATGAILRYQLPFFP